MKSKIKFFVLGVVTTVLLTTGFSALASGGVAKQLKVYYNNIKVVVDGSPASLGTDSSGKDNEAFIYNGTTYLPIRAVSEALGKDVSWDGKTSPVYVGTGLAQQGIGAAAFGAIAEDKGMLGLALVFIAIPETLVILGLVISIMIMFI